MPLSFDEARAAAGKTAPQVAPRESGLAPAAEKAGVKPSTGGIQFDVAGAKEAGYSEDEIASAVAKRANFDKDSAEKAGYSPQDIINFLVPTAKGAEQSKELATNIKEDFGRDPSKAGQVTGQDYFNRAAAGATTGGLIGAGVGAFTGPGAIVTGTAGAIGGAVSGLIEAGLEDLGFGKGTQFVGGMAAPGVGLGTKVGQFIETKIADKALQYAAKKVTGIPFAGAAVRALQSRKPVDVAALEKLTGIKGSTVDAKFSTEQANAVKQKIATDFEERTGSKIPQGVDPEEHIYDLTSSEINKANKTTAGTAATEAVKTPTVGEGWGGAETIAKEATPAVAGQKQSFVGSSFFNRAATLEGELNAAQARKYKSIFQDARGNNLPGQDIINNIRAFKYGEDLPKTAGFLAKDKRWEEGVKLEKEFNGWLQKQSGHAWQADARAAYEQVAVASARDKLPSLMESVAKAENKTELRTAASELENQMWNLSKSPEGQQQFWSQLAGNLKDIPAKDTKVLWQEIAPTIQKRFMKDPEKFNTLNDIMNNVKTPQDISRAVRVINALAIAGTTTGLR